MVEGELISKIVTTPVNSVIGLEDDVRRSYLRMTMQLPRALRKFMFAPKVAAYIRGLAKDNQLEAGKAQTVAFAVLRVAVGEVSLAKLSTVLSSDLQIANDKAQKMAESIEKELFAPVMRELNAQFNSQQKAKADVKNATANEAQVRAAGAGNVVDLKNSQSAPKPPMPPSPSIPQIPK